MRISPRNPRSLHSNISDNIRSEIAAIVADLKQKSIERAKNKTPINGWMEIVNWDIINYRAETFIISVSWDYLICRYNLSEELFNRIKCHINWGTISYRENIYSPFLLKYEKYLVGRRLIYNTFVPLRIRLALMKEYKMVEQESEKHFIQYSKVNNKLKEIEKLIDIINKV